METEAPLLNLAEHGYKSYVQCVPCGHWWRAPDVDSPLDMDINALICPNCGNGAKAAHGN